MTAESGSGGGAAAASRTLGYDLVGRVASVSHPLGTQSVTYNDRDLPVGSSGPAGSSTFGYEASGRMTSRTDGAGTSSFGYNARDDLTSTTGAATGGTRSLAYDDADQLTAVTYASGGAVRSFGYDSLGRTTSDMVTGPGGTLRVATYSYDANDNRLTETLSPAGLSGSGSQSFGYDRADRLTSWTSPANVTTSYGWDGAGNRTSAGGTAATFDERNRLLADGTATYTYTARGTGATRTAGGTTATTTFDGFDRLVSDSTSGTTTHGYDGWDRLAVRNSTTLGYAGVEKEPVGDGTSTYARDPDGDLIGLGTPGGNWVPLADPHGDVVAAFTTNGAGLTDQKAFDSFGVPTTAGSANVRVGFQGSWTDPTTAKVSAEARWYTPGTGGFVSRDSAGLPLTSGVSADPGSRVLCRLSFRRIWMSPGRAVAVRRRRCLPVRRRMPLPGRVEDESAVAGDATAAGSAVAAAAAGGQAVGS
ncbi:hypothetical protein [Frankia sp. Cas4]|uniref:hypothetical protein n=1 Tax=Frankia sp. Cas4 TaxID=3073927 RepID=UPI002AD5A19A|nr:hypothetical protein [Frankia sp. Cas4]